MADFASSLNLGGLDGSNGFVVNEEPLDHHICLGVPCCRSFEGG